MRRYPARLASYTTLLVFALNYAELWRLMSASVGSSGGSGNVTAAPAISSYNDTRPPAPNGYLCVYGAKGRLNNLIIQNLVGVHMAHRINRTLLVDPEVSKYYDVDRLSLTAYADSPFAAAVPISRTNQTCAAPGQISPHWINHGLGILHRFDHYHAQTRGLRLASVDNNDVWYWLGRPPESVYEKFFRGLVPRRSFEEKVDAFMEKSGMRRDSYNALHLRYFEGKCGHVDTDLCCPKLDHVREILVERSGSLTDPLFVANDGQCPEEVLRSYVNATDPVITGYDGPCDGVECAVIDFELCVRAGIFVGNMKSSGDMNIREWRLARYGKSGWTSVLSRQPETLAMEEKHAFVTRFFIGHWRLRPDCSQVGPKQRSHPCA